MAHDCGEGRWERGFHRTNGNKDSEETVGSTDCTAGYGQGTERKALRCAGGDGKADSPQGARVEEVQAGAEGGEGTREARGGARAGGGEAECGGDLKVYWLFLFLFLLYEKSRTFAL